MTSDTSTFERTGSIAAHGYRSGYRAEPVLRKNLAEVLQSILWLRQFIPGFVAATYSQAFFNRIEFGDISLPLEAERWGVLVRWSRLISPDYLEALRIVAGVLDKQGSFDYTALQSVEGKEHIKMLGRTAPVYQLLIEQQPSCDILIAPIQLGLRWRGKSVDGVGRTLWLSDTQNEAGIDFLNLLVQLITHPNRLQSARDLGIDDVGTRFYVNGRSRAPLLRFRKGSQVLEFVDPAEASESSGAATCFGSWMEVL